jgi:hypothetical protein
MIGHGYATGNGESAAGQIRGQRLACGKRNRQNGCGRTTCIWLATVARGKSVFTATISTVLQAGLDAASRHAGWRQSQTLRVSIRHCYRLWQQLARSQSHMRAALASCCMPPPLISTETRPLAQLQTHLQHECFAAGRSLDLLATFQLQFQRLALIRLAAN